MTSVLIAQVRDRAWRLSIPVVVAAGLVLWAWTPPDDPAMSVCVGRRTTGVPCPGCGMVRGLCQLAKGDVAAAIVYHPLAPLIAAQLAVAWTWWGLWSAGRLGAPSTGRLNGWLIGNLILLVAVWVGRASVGALPP